MSLRMYLIKYQYKGKIIGKTVQKNTYKNNCFTLVALKPLRRKRKLERSGVTPRLRTIKGKGNQWAR